MIIPVVTADIDPGALEDLIVLCVRYHAIRPKPPAPPPEPRGHPGGRRYSAWPGGPARADRHGRPPGRSRRRGGRGPG